MNYDVECKNCGMKFEAFTLFRKDTLRNGTEVKVKYYVCPKCDEEFILSVYSEESDRLRTLCNDLQDRIQEIYNMSDTDNNLKKLRLCREKLKETKEEMWQHDRQLKHKYLKEIRKHG